MLKPTFLLFYIGRRQRHGLLLCSEPLGRDDKNSMACLALSSWSREKDIFKEKFASSQLLGSTWWEQGVRMRSKACYIREIIFVKHCDYTPIMARQQRMHGFLNRLETLVHIRPGNRFWNRLWNRFRTRLCIRSHKRFWNRSQTRLSITKSIVTREIKFQLSKVWRT